MNILNKVTFAGFEPNLLKGLQPGFVEGLTKVKSGSTLFHKTYKTAVENGQLAMFVKGEGTVEMDAWKSSAGENPVMYITYSDPLNTIFNDDRFYATDTEEENVRFVQLIPGDEWTTTFDYKLSSNSELAKHVIEMTSEGNPDVNWFATSTMADGRACHHYKYIG